MYINLEKYPPHVRFKCAVDAVNGLNIRSTDCSSTYDFMMKSLDHAISLTYKLTSLEMFELILNLDEYGIEHMNKYIFREWDKQKINIWDYRQFEKTLAYITKNKILEKDDYKLITDK